MMNEFISDFLDDNTVAALPAFLEKDAGFESDANLIAQAFGADNDFCALSDEKQKKLINSFKRNLKLLIEKTWVEDSDIAIKEHVLYQLDRFCNTDDVDWVNVYELYLEIISEAVTLMFGQPIHTPDFVEYALRIDPEFGIFSWYITSLPKTVQWSKDKCRVAIELGMYFLANY